MIGDHVGISKAINFVKSVAGFYMVYLHGMTMFGLANPWIDFSQLSMAVKAFSLIKISLAGALPAFAGFYLRSEIGPYLQNHKIPLSFIKKGFQFFTLAVFFEALRMLLITGSLAYIFNWHALHFISLSMIVTYFILSIDSRLLLPFTMCLMLSSGKLAELTTPFIITAGDITPATFAFCSWIWCFLLALLIVVILCWLPFLVWRNLKALRLTYILGAAVFAIILSFFSHDLVLANPRSVTSLINLPRSVFFANSFDDNYWPFTLCFQGFSLGYFLRVFLFDIEYRKYFHLMNCMAFAAIAYFFAFQFAPREDVLNQHTTFSKFDFSTRIGVFAWPAIFYFAIVLAYYFLRLGKFSLVGSYVKRTQSVLLLYLIHGPVLRLAIFLFPSSFVARYRDSMATALWFVEIYVVLAYVASAGLAYLLSRRLEASSDASAKSYV